VAIPQNTCSKRTDIIASCRIRTRKHVARVKSVDLGVNSSSTWYMPTAALPPGRVFVVTFDPVSSLGNSTDPLQQLLQQLLAPILKQP